MNIDLKIGQSISTHRLTDELCHLEIKNDKNKKMHCKYTNRWKDLFVRKKDGMDPRSGLIEKLEYITKLPFKNKDIKLIKIEHNNTKEYYFKLIKNINKDQIINIPPEINEIKFN